MIANGSERSERGIPNRGRLLKVRLAGLSATSGTLFRRRDRACGAD
jgi:hypothetical protein